MKQQQQQHLQQGHNKQYNHWKNEYHYRNHRNLHIRQQLIRLSQSSVSSILSIPTSTTKSTTLFAYSTNQDSASSSSSSPNSDSPKRRSTNNNNNKNEQSVDRSSDTPCRTSNNYFNKRRSSGNNNNIKKSSSFRTTGTRIVKSNNRRVDDDDEYEPIPWHDDDDYNEEEIGTVPKLTESVNRQRIMKDNINCIHFNQDVQACSGCMVMQGIGTPEKIPIIQSATLFFNSPSIKRHYQALSSSSSSSKNTFNNKRQNDNRYEQKRRQTRDDDNDNDASFFQIIVPSAITGWRTQAKLVATTLAVTNNQDTQQQNFNSRWRRDKDGCSFGLYQRSSHTVAPITQCSVHDPLINTAIEYLQIATRKAGIVAFDDGNSYNSNNNNNVASASNRRRLSSSAKGSQYNDNNNNNMDYGHRLRYVQIQVERITQQVCLTLVFYSSELKQTQPALSRLVKELKNAAAASTSKSALQDDANDIQQGGQQQQQQPFWHSIWCHCNDSPGNNIFARSLSRWHRLTGPEFIREPIPVSLPSSLNLMEQSKGFLYYTPQSFRQGNLNGFDMIARTVAKLIPNNSKVCELYAGGGILGLTTLNYHYYRSISDRNNNKYKPIQWLRCSDENPINPKCFYRSVESLPLEMTGRSTRTNNNNNNNNYKSNDKHFSKSNNSQRRNFNNDDTMTLGEIAQQTRSNGATSRQKQNMEDKITYMVASASDALKNGQALGATVLIVDPPRKGLDDDVLHELCKPINVKQPYFENIDSLNYYYYNNDIDYDDDDTNINWCNDIQTLIYVSCGFDAFTRDCQRLVSVGWKIQSATGYVLFPGTDHLETLAVFQR